MGGAPAGFPRAPKPIPDGRSSRSFRRKGWNTTRNRGCRTRRLIRLLLAVAVIFLVLSLGPDVTIGGTPYRDVMPYCVLAKIPPFTSFWAPGRMVVVALFALAVPAALALTRLWTAGRAGRWLVVACGVFAAVECYAPDHNVIENNVFSGWSLRRLFATPSQELAERVALEGQSGPWVTLPPKGYDMAGLLAQMFHHQPIFGGSWLSRWTLEQINAWQELYRVYRESKEKADAQRLATWLSDRGVRNILLTEDGLGDEYVRVLSRTLNVVDARTYFPLDLYPFRHYNR
mgnify:CR=1 FL=1